MKPRATRRTKRQGSEHVTNVKGTFRDLVNPTRSHAADFRRILPSQMDKLVEQGLFERLPHDEIGRPQYRITAKGRQYLKDFESK